MIVVDVFWSLGTVTDLLAVVVGKQGHAPCITHLALEILMAVNYYGHQIA